MNSQTVLLGAKPPETRAHGGGVRGAVASRRSPQFEGRFGRIFRTLPPADFGLKELEALAAVGKMSARPETLRGKPSAAVEDESSAFHDAEENTGIAAGYTYFGQFIDHDITFDPASSLVKLNDPDGLINFRTPRLDLDSLYGRGPDDQPYMYTSDGRRFLLGRALTADGTPTTSRDLPRHTWTENPERLQNEGGPKTFDRALIGDKRNDENVIVSQLHGALMQLHNRFADEFSNASFAELQRLVRWHYQWVVLHDFLPTIVGKDLVHSILPHLQSGKSPVEDKPQLRFYHPRDASFMPIEFAAAAYRFGHSMVRPIYRLNTQLKGGEKQEATADEIERGLEGRFFIFAGVSQRALNGFRAFPAKWAIDWSLFFDIGGSGQRVGAARVQPSYKIDASLVNPLAFLPEFSHTSNKKQRPLTLKSLQPRPLSGAIQNLAERNLKRGLFMSLPSGQDVAEAMGESPLADADLLIEKSTFEDQFGKSRPQRLTDVSTTFAGRAPLWFYVLAEASAQWRAEVTRQRKTGDDADRVGVRLGPVGGRIVAETLIGMLIGDSHSFLSQKPRWQPSIQPGASNRPLSVGDLIAYALRL